MWGCNYIPYASGWNGWIPMVFWLLILGGIALLAFKALCGKPRNGNQDADRNDSLAILKTRLARGEINMDEYNTLKSVL
ncbi:SHOCT domain-containing protein [Fundidesulfovibrio putealis]|uniref:SHOCT domain-containing protein n=1 Tax=Fundidesulfovibrio putealis TaxID=270496 RepID=UPI000687BCE0|nr:SHOCT domain-containing protein [Fundidesulfovibrio putealis]